MGQIRHESATTMHAVRAAIQQSQALIAALSKEFVIKAETVAKPRERSFVEDLKTEPLFGPRFHSDFTGRTGWATIQI